VSLYRDTAVVLRVQKLGEADRIITLITQRHGKVRAVAKGVRRTGSRFGARVEPFAHVDLQLYTGRTLDVITQVQTIDAFGASIVGDYQRYTAGCAVLETADRLSAEEGEPVVRLYLLVAGALRALAAGERDATLVLDAFLLRAMAFAGWAPAVSECARCSVPGPHRAFSVPAGGAVCPGCRPPGSTSPAGETLLLLDALMRGDWPSADAAAPPARREGSGLVAALLQWHLERQLRSLPLVERRAPAPHPATRALPRPDRHLTAEPEPPEPPESEWLAQPASDRTSTLRPTEGRPPEPAPRTHPDSGVEFGADIPPEPAWLGHPDPDERFEAEFPVPDPGEEDPR